MNTRSYLNGVLTVLAVLAALHLLVRMGDHPAAARAEAAMQDARSVYDDGEGGGGGKAPLPFNAAEQRKTMISQLDQINARLGRLESKLEKGISVKVTDMPAIKIEGGGGKE